MTAVAAVLDVVVVLLLLHTVVNAVLVRRPPQGTVVDERVSVLIPMRDEAAHAAAAVASAIAQQGLPDHEVIVYDDCSSDETAAVVRSVGGASVRLLNGAPPRGWLGKPHACARLAEVASGSVLVFVDADVVLAPDAIAATVTLLRSTGMAFVSPYPRQLTGSWLERLVQPLLQWSWLTFLPLRVAERSTRPSLAAANGQILAVDAEVYRRAGGHAAVRGEVVEDMALARALVGIGGRGTFVDGRSLATCRMYDGPRALVDGYAKSLWCAFGPPPAAIAVAGLTLVIGVVPWALVAATPVAWPAVVGGLLGRVVAAVRAGNRPIADALLHPLSVLAFVALVAVSLGRHLRGTLSWKGRPVA